MADKLVFDSERLEKRQRLRRWLFPALALLALILIAAALALILRGGRGIVHSGGEDTPYPYTWQEGKNGVVTLELDRSAAPGYLWLPAEGESPIMAVAGEQEESLTRLTLTPQGEGRGVLVFTLLRDGDPLDGIYAYSVLAEVTVSGRNLHTELLSISGRPLQGTVQGGVGTDYPYLLCRDEDGDLILAVTDNAPPREETGEESGGEKKEGWTCVSQDETVAEVLGIVTLENTAAAYLRPGTEAGTVLVYMRDSVNGTEIILELEGDGSGTLLLLDHSLKIGDQG